MTNREYLENLFEYSLKQHALDIAALVHGGKKRKTGKDAIMHPMQVYSYISQLDLPIKEKSKLEFIAILHDTIEDSKKDGIISDKENNFIYSEIKRRFGIDVADAVWALSHDKRIVYDEYLEKLASDTSNEGKRIFLIKMLDMRNNLQDSPTEKQYNKYKNAIMNLMDKKLDANIPDYIFKLLNIKNAKVNENYNISKLILEKDEEPEDNKKSIVYYDDKLKKSKIINMQRFGEHSVENLYTDVNLYSNDYVSITKDGSMLLAVPSTINSDSDKNIIIKNITTTMAYAIYNAFVNKKSVIIFNNYTLPYNNIKYFTDIIEKLYNGLNIKSKNIIKLNLWDSNKHYSFLINSQILNLLKKRCECKKSEVVAAVYVYLKFLNCNIDILNKLKNSSVDNILTMWGFDADDPNRLIELIFPEAKGNAQTLTSFIIKTYLQLLNVNMIKKVLEYQNDNCIVIVPVNYDISWSLNKSFKNITKLAKAKNKKSDGKSKKLDKKSATDKNDATDKSGLDKSVPDKTDTTKTPASDNPKDVKNSVPDKPDSTKKSVSDKTDNTEKS